MKEGFVKKIDGIRKWVWNLSKPRHIRREIENARRRKQIAKGMLRKENGLLERSG